MPVAVPARRGTENGLDDVKMDPLPIEELSKSGVVGNTKGVAKRLHLKMQIADGPAKPCSAGRIAVQRDLEYGLRGLGDAICGYRGFSKHVFVVKRVFKLEAKFRSIIGRSTPAAPRKCVAIHPEWNDPLC